MAKLYEGIFIKGRGHWAAHLRDDCWRLRYGPHELWPPLEGDIQQVKRLVDLLNRDDRDYGSILTSMLCLGFDVDGPLEPR